MGDTYAKEVSLSMRLRSLIGHHIDDVRVTEEENGLKVRINSHCHSDLEPENDLAITFSSSYFFIPKKEEEVM